jgi:SAM-dependent methyltransferase
LKRWQKSRPCAPLEEFSFVDVGAGMGRAMLLASEYPFRKVEGIELTPILATIARRNAVKWRWAGRALAPMRISCGDAVENRFPKGPCLVFLFNPFGALVLRRLLVRLAARFSDRSGQLDLLYVNHEQEHVIEQQRGFVRLFHGQVRRSRADAIADHRIMANQPDGEYASSNYEDCSIWRWEGL